MRPLIRLLSKLPFPVLHVLSSGIAFLMVRVFGYRKKTVRGNLERSFPEKSKAEIRAIERQFYANFADILIETIKNFAITEAELRDRCRLTTPEVAKELWAKQVNVAGISSHLANWEILALSLSLEFQHHCYGVYKPLSDPKMDAEIRVSRQRFGIEMIPIKAVRGVLEQPPAKPWLLGLLGDQAPHDYEKAFEVQFLNQRTYVVPGPGLLTLEQGLTPIWGWMRRRPDLGRSRFEWGVEILSTEASGFEWTSADRAQIERIARVHAVSLETAERALALTRRVAERLEARIRENPADWLWTHRRWKAR
jgi:KDO2-lipid IV(A) lauroyltransferase